MLLSFAYLGFSALLRLLVGRRRSAFVKDVELLVLRHQLAALRRQQPRPAVRAADRAFLAALIWVLPPPRRLGCDRAATVAALRRRSGRVLELHERASPHCCTRRRRGASTWSAPPGPRSRQRPLPARRCAGECLTRSPNGTSVWRPPAKPSLTSTSPARARRLLPIRAA